MRITEQVRLLVRANVPGTPFSPAGSAVWGAGFLIVLAATLYLNQRFSPWTRLRIPGNPAFQSATVPPPLTNLSASAAEPSQPWGEVRITEPGRDLHVTKVDVVPLTIEASGNRDLTEVGWYSSINGSQEQAHALPPPRDSRNALYQPTLYLDQFTFSDWDILSYYAKAVTDNTNTYVSEVYFLEVQPFREDILKMPGGEGGQPYRTLSEITSLIGRQQHVIRETHQLAHRSAEPEREEKARTQLSEAESDLGKAVQHLYAEMAGTMENQPIGPALENLAKAEVSLQSAADLLKSKPLPLARDQELSALSELVAARKIFQKAVSEHPGDFAPGPGETPPVATSAKKLSEMAEFRDESKSAVDFLKKLSEEQKQVEQSSHGTMPEKDSRLAEQEQALDRALKAFLEEHPRPFKPVKTQAQQASRSLQEAGEQLQAKANDASAATEKATRNLEQLHSAMRASSAGQNLAGAYRLKQMLKEQIQSLDKLARSQTADPSGQATETAQSSRQLIEQMKQALKSGRLDGELGQAVQRKLTDQAKSDLDQKLAKLEQAKDDSERRRSAEEAREGLEGLDKALAASEPKSLQAARQSDSLKPDQGAEFAEGMSQLDSLLKQLGQGGALSPGNQQKQARQAVANIQEGISKQFGQDSRANDLVSELRSMMANPRGLTPQNLQGLLERLERFSIETRPRLAGPVEPNAIFKLDPAHFPVAYRDRVEKYFQKLSEQ